MDALNGISGADVICTTEAGGSPSKALLVDESGCSGQPCRRASVTPNVGDGQVDWPLMPSTSYCNMDSSAVVSVTGINRLFSKAFNTSAISPSSCLNQASGMDKDWTTRAGMSCGNWIVSAGESMRLGVGWICSNDPYSNDMLNGGSITCSSSVRIICVETPASAPFPPLPPPLPPPSPSPPRAPFSVVEISNYTPYIAGGPHVVAYLGLRVAVVVSDGVSNIIYLMTALRPDIHNVCSQMFLLLFTGL